jgi:hypothetical protein
VKIIQIFIWTCFSIALYSQSNKSFTSVQTVRKGIIYKNEWSLDASIHTNGFYFGYNKGKIKNYHTTSYLHFDLGLLYNPLETRSSRTTSSGFKNFSSSYTFGKQNQLINLRIGRGIITTFTEKARTKGIAIGMRLEGGFNLGLLKPYYLKLSENVDGKTIIDERKYTKEDENFLDPASIQGSGSFFRGFGEMSIVPGVFGRIALRLDPGAFEKMVRCLEAGIQIDVYSKRPAVMILENNPYSYINFYINLQLGSRKS